MNASLFPIDHQWFANQMVRGPGLAALLLMLSLSACSSSNSPSSISDSASDVETGADVDNSAGSPNVSTPVSTDNSPSTTDSPNVTAQSATQARYRLSFTASWSQETHPLHFPDNPHFSGLVGAVHNEQVRFWEPGQMASPGIQLMAETGGKSAMLTEVRNAIDAGLALSEINGGGIGTSPDTTSIEFEVTRDYPQITVTSMLAPSPDWFIGLHNFTLVDDGGFIDAETIELNLYDGGSDNGLRYTSANDATVPLSPITIVTSDPADSPFIEGSPPVGTFTLQRLSME